MTGFVLRAQPGRSPLDDPDCEIWGRVTAGGGATAVAERFGRARDLRAALRPLRGEFAAAIWDPEVGELIIARDQLGAMTVHFARTANGLVVAEHVRDLLPLLPTAPGPDRRTVALWLARGLTPAGRSPYESIERLGPGMALRWKGRDTRIESWWKPLYAGGRDGAPDELASRTVEAMDRAVGRAAGDAVMLSGGLDSAAVASAAVADGRIARAYSGVFPAHPEIDEGERIDSIAHHVGLPVTKLELGEGGPVRAGLDHLTEWKVPPASPNHFVWRPLFDRAAADGVRVMLDGEGGDELFDVSPHAVPLSLRDRLRTRAPHLAHRLRARLRPAPLPDWIDPALEQLIRTDLDRFAWKRGSGPAWWRHQAYLLTAAREALDASGYLRRRAGEAGLVARHPLLHDVDLVETVLETPVASRVERGVDRVLLRRGLSGRLPEAVLRPSRKPRFDALLSDALEGGDGALLRRWLSEPGAETRAYVRGSPAEAPATALWRLGMMEAWLRSLADPGFPDRAR